MKKKVEQKLEAVKLRRQGHSLKEITEKLNVAKSSASTWVRNISLNEKAKKRLLTRITLGQFRGAESKRRKTETFVNKSLDEAKDSFSGITFNHSWNLAVCSLLYWCEGTKNPQRSAVSFANSDPILIKAFLKAFRASFNLDEKKFRCCVHLHEYHNAKKQLTFWSKVTGIPKCQFMKPYLKPHTGIQTRENYPGCIAVRYSDNNMGRRLLASSRVFSELFLGLVV